MAKKNKKKDDFVDDGRVIADMNLDGMPWTMPKPYRFSELINKSKKREQNREQNVEIPPDVDLSEPPITKKEARKMALNAMLAGLAIALVFAAAAFLFILFCTNVWLA